MPRLTIFFVAMLAAWAVSVLKAAPIAHVRSLVEQAGKKLLLQLATSQQKLFAGVAVSSVLTLALNSYLSNPSGFVTIKSDFDQFVFNLERSEIPASKAPYVSRPGVETALMAELDRERVVKYVVVFGAKGAGKTTLVHHCAEGRKAAITVGVSSSVTSEDVAAALAKKLLGASLGSSDIFEDVCAAVQKCSPRPTIIFDVERGGTGGRMAGPSAVAAVRSFAKELMAAGAHVVIVLSEASAVLEFGRDSARECYFFVGELTDEEARRLLAARGCELGEEDVKMVLDRIGSSPLMLEELAESVPRDMSLPQFVELKLKQARRELRNFHHKAILQALKASPQGVSLEEFRDQTNKGVPLDEAVEVAAAMRSNAIVYRMDLDEYHLMSRAHRTALRSYEPLVAPAPPAPAPPAPAPPAPASG